MQPPGAPPRLTDKNGSPALRAGYHAMSDPDLVQRATGGDRHALEALLERYTPRVSRLAQQLVDDFEDARDATQESLVKLVTRLRQFRGEAQFATWLHRLVVNTCRDLTARKRIRQTEPLPLDDAVADDDLDPARAVLLGEVRAELADALSRLSPNQRLAVVLRDAFDFSYEDIARIARMPVGTAKSYVHRGHTRLRARLEELAQT